MKPKLRPVQPSLVHHEGNAYIVLGDPLNLSENAVAVPQQLGPLLELCDGTRDLRALQAAFELRTGVRLGQEFLQQLVSHLDEALLLESDRFAEARAGLVSEFHAAPARAPALAGSGYPADPRQLKEELERHLDGIDRMAVRADLRGLVSPHIDYRRGGPVYARVWSMAAPTIADIDLAIIFGTNHIGGYTLFTLTRQNYSTPWGGLPTAAELVSDLAADLGERAVFEWELCHKQEHSIELALVWLHYFLGDRQCEVLPILCGSFDPFINGHGHPNQNEQINTVVDRLREVIASRKALVVAAADLAHVGPAFGDPQPLDAVARAGITAADTELINAVCSADADRFYEQVNRESDRRRICGLSPIYMTLRLLGPARGELTGYTHCPADETNGSLVSICGIGLR